MGQKLLGSYFLSYQPFNSCLSNVTGEALDDEEDFEEEEEGDEEDDDEDAEDEDPDFDPSDPKMLKTKKNGGAPAECKQQ